MKLTGMFLLLLSGVLLGWRKAAELERRVALLTDLRRMLQSFRTGIGYAAAPLTDLIRETEDSAFCRLAREDGEFPQKPKAALERAGERLLREESDRKLFRSLIDGLGESGAQGQLEHLELYAALVETALAQAGEAREKKAKLCLCLGAFGGVLFCLLLW